MKKIETVKWTTFSYFLPPSIAMCLFFGKEVGKSEIFFAFFWFLFCL